MTYEEKLELIVRAIVEARKATRKGQSTTLYLNATNGLDRLDRDEIRNILLQLQDENVLKVNPKTNRLLPLSQQTANPNYFLLDILDGFDTWYEYYLLKQKSGISEMTDLNLLRLFDTMLAIQEKVQLNRENTVIIPLLPPRIYFQELLPYDTPGVRDEYIEGRWEAVKHLHKESVLLEFKHIDSMMHRWDDRIKVTVNIKLFYDFMEKVRRELEKRKNENKNKKTKLTKKITTSKQDVASYRKATFDEKTGILSIEGKEIKLRKNSFRTNLIALILKDNESRERKWSWDEIIEEIEGIRDLDLLKEKKKKFYPACDGLMKFIAQKTGINDFLLYDFNTVQLNPKYL